MLNSYVILYKNNSYNFIMGIPSYFSYIIKNHATIIKKQKNIRNIDNLYLDSNSIIYDSLYEINYTNNIDYEKNIIEKVIIKIKGYIKNINPAKSVFIAFDGVAPVAKLEQQRTRRFKSKYTEDIIKSVSEKTVVTRWDKTAITPGTNFMKNLTNEIKNAFINNKKVIVSGTDHVGEGEHKLFNFIRENKEKHSKEVTLVYGLDADLIMLGLCNSYLCKEIYIYRETPEFIKSIDYNFEPNELYCLDIKSLSSSIVYEMTNKSHTSFLNKNILHDYIFICFLLGNDFLPHFPALNIRTHGINILLSAYYNTLGRIKKTIINNGDINWGNFKKMIAWIKNNEENNLLIEYELRNKFECKKDYSKTPEEKLNIIPIKKREIEKQINPFEPGWDKRYYKLLFNYDYNKELIKKICINYLEGLEWVFKYYTEDCCDWRWRYNYHYPPLFKDLVEYIPNWETIMIEENQNTPLEPIAQLAYVLPIQSINLLPKEVIENIREYEEDFYKDDFNIKWAFCKYLWEAHVDFTEVCIDEFERCVLKSLKV